MIGSRRLLMGLTAVVAAAVALCLYWPILQLPLSFDDLLHIRLVKALDYRTVWQVNSGFAYYRPLLFLPVLLVQSLFGYYPAPFMYALNLLLHTVNVLLLVGLVWRVSPRWSLALMVGLLFATYPFAAQAVAVFGNNIYPMLVSLMLLGLHSYLSAVRGKPVWWLATAVCFVLGLLSHELMVLFGFYATLLHLLLADKRPQRWDDLFTLPATFFIAAGALYIVGYQLLPLAGSTPTAVDQPWLELLYLLQAVVYPLAQLAQQLLVRSPLAFSGQTAVLLSLVGLLLATAWAARQRPWWLLAGWGWWGITAVLLLVTLSTDYLLHGPRLHYLGSIGVVFIWATVFDHLAQQRRLGRWLAAFGLLATVAASAFFVHGRLTALYALGEPVRFLQQQMAPRPLAEAVLFINLPSWAAPSQNSFPIGVEHAALMGEHIFAEELVWENLRQQRPVRAIALPEQLAQTDYAYGIHAQADGIGQLADWAPAGASVFVSRFLPDGVQTELRGRLLPTAVADEAELARWGEYRLQMATAVACADQLQIDLTWQLPQTPHPTHSLFVQAFSGDGRLLGQADGPPLNIPATALVLPPNWHATDYRRIPLASETAVYLLVGVYNYQTGERLPGQDEQARPLADNAWQIPVTNVPQSCSQ